MKMRGASRALGGVVGVALLVFFFQAPVLHVHEPGHASAHVKEQHHKGLLLHTHLVTVAFAGALPIGSPIFSDADRSAHPLNLYQVNKQSRIEIVGTPAEAASKLPAPSATGRHIPTETPVILTLQRAGPDSPRGPPFLLLAA